MEIVRRNKYAGALGVNSSRALSNSDRKGLAREYAYDCKVQDYQNNLLRRKMFNVAEGTVVAEAYVGIIVRAGDAEIAMNPSAAPYIQQIRSIGVMGLGYVLQDMAG